MRKSSNLFSKFKVIFCAKYRFTKLNELLLNLLTSSLDFPQHKQVLQPINDLKILKIGTIEKSSRNYVTIIKIAKQIHLQLIKICQESDNSYGFQILSSILVAIMVITANMYMEYIIVVKLNLPRKFVYRTIIIGSIWITYHIAKLFALSWVCSSCVEQLSYIHDHSYQQAIKTGDVINEFYDDPVIDNRTKTEIRYFNVQLIQKPLKFTAYGFIDLDFTLVQGIIATITTYLMILIQLAHIPSSPIFQNNSTSNALIRTIAYPTIIKWSELCAFDNKVPVKILFYSNIIINVCFVIMGWYRSKGLNICLNRALQIDVLMERIGIQRDYNKMFRCQLSKMCLFLLFSFAVISAHSFIVLSQNEPITSKVLTMTVIVPSYKFELLNNRLKKMLTSKADSPLYRRIIKPLKSYKDSSPQLNAKVLRSPVVIIKTAREVHMLLTKGCQELNHLFGLQILLSLVIAFGVITGYLYDTYMLMHESNSRKSIIYKAISSSSIWIVYYTVKIWCLSWACDSCTQNCIRTGSLINELYDEPSISDDTKAEIRNFNIQLIQRPLRFNACGFIDLDYTLIQTMVGSITTYLMILIQLGNSQETTMSQELKKNATNHLHNVGTFRVND
ncbi:hypothetical protein TSAR_013002 [Trichomalopsis sarcophagae]|uniref:Gustatory receptor n=1 Tax=Trichomalopsis sarcophagae TaxID=543379 RepID=A0A232F8J2_9HYME|nr:hypothetical protein TSAR_013002 [Trichomalopsis sarcophagae]